MPGLCTAKHFFSLGRRKSSEKYFLENQRNLLRKITTAFQGGFVLWASIWNQKEITQKETDYSYPKKPHDSQYWKSTEPKWCLIQGNRVFHTSVLSTFCYELKFYHLSHVVLFFKAWHLNESILKRTQNVLPCQTTPKAPTQPHMRVQRKLGMFWVMLQSPCRSGSQCLTVPRWESKQHLSQPWLLHSPFLRRRERCLILLKQEYDIWKEGISSITQLQCGIEGKKKTIKNM